MYCILVTGIPASGKSTMAEFLAERLRLPMLSKDKIKEILFDDVGFASRSEKVALGISAMNILYYTARQLMKCGRPFILENNFENISREGILFLLQKYSYHAVTVVLTGNYEIIYQRFLARNESPDRHRGHVVNDCYPEKKGNPVLRQSCRMKISVRESGSVEWTAFVQTVPVLLWIPLIFHL